VAGNPKKLAFDRGRRWEYKCRDWFRSAGFKASKFDESNGYCVGCDIHLEVYLRVLHTWKWVTVPVAIQCKNTENPRDLFVGIDEARRGWKNAKLFICLHWHRPKGKGQRGTLRMAVSDDPSPGAPYELMIGNAAFIPLFERIYPAIPSTEDHLTVLQNTIDQQTKEENERR
jgi:hypothetical protein